MVTPGFANLGPSTAATQKRRNLSTLSLSQRPHYFPVSSLPIPLILPRISSTSSVHRILEWLFTPDTHSARPSPIHT